MISPGALAGGTAARWPLASTMPPLGALATAPASARAHVHAVLPGWHLADLADDTATVVSELVTNAVQASTTPAGKPAYTGGHIAVVRLRLLSDGQRMLAEVWDQASGFPAPRQAGTGDENGRGLQLVNALTNGRWGWQATGPQAKIVWAELTAQLPDLPQMQADAWRARNGGRDCECRLPACPGTHPNQALHSIRKARHGDSKQRIATPPASPTVATGPRYATRYPPLSRARIWVSSL